MKTTPLIRFILISLLMLNPLVGISGDQGPMQSAGQWIDDVAMATAVKTVILGDTGLKGFDINVIVKQANVQLSGFVDTQAEAEHAVELAKSVNGVKSVTNSLIIKE
jgi:hyperosmotically inducible periplasmic protein